MSTDNNKFDDWLKKKLYRDLLFRAMIWSFIAFATGYVAVYSNGADAISYLARMSETLVPLVNLIGAASLLICVFALMLKDLEATLTNQKLIDAMRGEVGGFARRLAGDLSLWTIGAFVTIGVTLLLVLTKIQVSHKEAAAVAFLLLILAIFAAAIGIANILVRRSGPTPLVKHGLGPRSIGLIYVISLSALILRLHWVT